MAIKVLGLVDCFGSPELGPMTKHRSIASTSFLGRYAFIDFHLSNLFNSNIPSIGILCQNHIRSLSRHVGNGRYWIGNTKMGQFSVLYDEPNVANSAYNTDIADILENHWFFDATAPDYVVITSPGLLYEADFSALLQDHIASGSRISLLYSHQKNLKTSFINRQKVCVSERGKITKFERNRGDSDEGDVSLGTMILDYPMLQNLIEYASNTSSFFGLQDTLSYLSPSVLIRGIRHDGYVRSFDSLSHYLQYSMELLDEEVFHSLFKDKWLIYTKTYDTPPALYKPGCKVQNSYVANGCVIEGTVINSVLGRSVYVKKGSVIANSVISSNSSIECDTHIENAIVDKEAKVMHISQVIGTPENPVYIAQGDIV